MPIANSKSFFSSSVAPSSSSLFGGREKNLSSSSLLTPKELSVRSSGSSSLSGRMYGGNVYRCAQSFRMTSTHSAFAASRAVSDACSAAEILSATMCAIHWAVTSSPSFKPATIRLPSSMTALERSSDSIVSDQVAAVVGIVVEGVVIVAGLVFRWLPAHLDSDDQGCVRVPIQQCANELVVGAEPSAGQDVALIPVARAARP